MAEIMNREIKFRAWNSELNQMEYCTTDRYWYISTAKDSIRWGLFHKYDEHRILSGEHPKPPLMQFIGLKDKNKKEIYEADLVKINDTTFAIEYDDSSACFCYIRILKFPISSERFDNCEIEIIGNIYQNPEIL